MLELGQESKLRPKTQNTFILSKNKYYTDFCTFILWTFDIDLIAVSTNYKRNKEDTYMPGENMHMLLKKCLSRVMVLLILLKDCELWGYWKQVLPNDLNKNTMDTCLIKSLIAIWTNVFNFFLASLNIMSLFITIFLNIS